MSPLFLVNIGSIGRHLSSLRHLVTNFSENVNEIEPFQLKEIDIIMLSTKMAAILFRPPHVQQPCSVDDTDAIQPVAARGTQSRLAVAAAAQGSRFSSRREILEKSVAMKNFIRLMIWKSSYNSKAYEGLSDQRWMVVLISVNDVVLLAIGHIAQMAGHLLGLLCWHPIV